MKRAVADLAPRFCAARLIREYADRIYMTGDLARIRDMATEDTGRESS